MLAFISALSQWSITIFFCLTDGNAATEFMAGAGAGAEQHENLAAKGLAGAFFFLSTFSSQAHKQMQNKVHM